ncbi:hypothetical protein, partial [Escherichia coli]|uniref:hypothetical protein n=1 Tax=Escherichia coli TaxID=562 RepID=UPI001ABA0D30
MQDWMFREAPDVSGHNKIIAFSSCHFMPQTATPGGFFYSEFSIYAARYGGPFSYPRHARRISKTTEPFRGELTGW